MRNKKKQKACQILCKDQWIEGMKSSHFKLGVSYTADGKLVNEEVFCSSIHGDFSFRGI